MKAAKPSSAADSSRRTASVSTAAMTNMPSRVMGRSSNQASAEAVASSSATTA